ncbi:MAG: SRPBCC domain-containing protein [Promethearchaeota archaeon]
MIKEEFNCDVPTAFKMFTENNLIESWLTEKADVEAKIRGKYELFWDPNNPKDNSTIGCKVTGVEPNKFISFDWKGPVQFKSFMNSADPLTHIIVFFSVNDHLNQNNTNIYLFHTGWRKTQEWQDARNFFEKAWKKAFKELKERISEGINI